MKTRELTVTLNSNWVKMKLIKKYLLWGVPVAMMLCPIAVEACTSAIVSGRLTADGRPLLWKHRDTGTEHNFVARVEPESKGELPFVALFNGGDSLLREAWIGVNEAGFAVMNTASYNLAPDTARFKDQEGVLMAKALKKCHTLSDFETLLDTLPKPLGVQANFGAIDASGNGAYYETDDYGYVKYALNDSCGILIRSNYSYSGDSVSGFGYIRHDNAKYLLREYVQSHTITPEVFTDSLSRSLYHSLYGEDMAVSGERWLVDQDFIPRYSSSASVVIEGVKPGENPRLSMMWTEIGYPPCSHTLPVMVDSVPQELLPHGYLWRSPLCDRVVERKHRLVFPIHRGSGSKYMDLPQFIKESASGKNQSAEGYRQGRLLRDKMANQYKKLEKY